jgi:hypothetical protein
VTRFNSKWGAAVLIGLAALYLLLSLVTRRSAASDRPTDLSASDAGLDVWKAAALLVREGGKVAVVDLRPMDRFDLYHVPRSRNVARGDAADVAKLGFSGDYVLIIAEQDKDAEEVAAGLAKVDRSKHVHFLKDGVRAWYLAFELPVALFSDKPSPHGWDDAMATVRAWQAAGESRNAAEVLAALGTLSKAGYEPSMLQGRKPAAPSGASRKKITGGCGG